MAGDSVLRCQKREENDPIPVYDPSDKQHYRESNIKCQRGTDGRRLTPRDFVIPHNVLATPRGGGGSRKEATYLAVPSSRTSFKKGSLSTRRLSGLGAHQDRATHVNRGGTHTPAASLSAASDEGRQEVMFHWRKPAIRRRHPVARPTRATSRAKLCDCRIATLFDHGSAKTTSRQRGIAKRQTRSIRQPRSTARTGQVVFARGVSGRVSRGRPASRASR